MKIRGKIFSMVLIPALGIGVAAILLSGSAIKSNMKEEIKSQMKVAAYAGENAYEYAITQATESGTSDDSEAAINSVIDNIYNNGGLHASVFQGDERIASTIKDETGNRVVGSKASQDVIDKVMTQGEDYFTEDVVVGDKDYFAYYTPVKMKETGEIIGAFVTATLNKI